MDNLTHSGAFAMFAASAPDVPDWFEHISLVVPPPYGEVKVGSVRLRRETPMEHLVRWRIAYATAMVAGITSYLANPQQQQQ
jgi:hypothetical protein